MNRIIASALAGFAATALVCGGAGCSSEKTKATASSSSANGNAEGLETSDATTSALPPVSEDGGGVCSVISNSEAAELTVGGDFVSSGFETPTPQCNWVRRDGSYLMTVITGLTEANYNEACSDAEPEYGIGDTSCFTHLNGGDKTPVIWVKKGNKFFYVNEADVTKDGSLSSALINFASAFAAGFR